MCSNKIFVLLIYEIRLSAFKVLPEKKTLVNVTMDQKDIERKSQIYDTSKIDTSHKMWSYYCEINKASLKLAMDNPDLLNNKNKLTSLARKLAHENGYTYKKRKTRSKQFGDGGESKREYLSEALKVKRLQEIQEDLTDTDTQMALLTRQREKHVNVKQFGQAANITDQISQLRGKKRKLEQELTLIQAKKRQCQRQKSKVIKVSTNQAPPKISTFFNISTTTAASAGKNNSKVQGAKTLQEDSRQNTDRPDKEPTRTASLPKNSTATTTAVSDTQEKSEEGPKTVGEDIVQNTGKPDEELRKTASLAKTSVTTAAVSDKQKESQEGPKSTQEDIREISNKPDSFLL